MTTVPHTRDTAHIPKPPFNSPRRQRPGLGDVVVRTTEAGALRTTEDGLLRINE
jgi:hypothetical protein